MPEPGLGHCKLCELEDFADPELRELIRDVYASDREYFGEPDFRRAASTASTGRWR